MLNYCFIFTCFVSLPSFISLTFASPVASPSASQSSSGSFPTLNIAVPRPPKRPVCPPDLGPRRGWTKFFVRDCQAAIAKIPRDARPSAPPRNFYLLTSDIVAGAENVQLPLEYESGDCVVQLLMAASFMDVPHDYATWIDIWGPSRLILQQCIISQNTGGIVTNIGQNEKLDLAIYSKRSLFAQSRRLRNSPDPLAADLAEIEFLQLLGIAPRQPLDVGALDGNGTSTAVADGTATA